VTNHSQVNLGSMAQLTKYERVMRTVRHEETDRTPVFDLLRNDATISSFAGERLNTDDERIHGIGIGRTLDIARTTYAPQVPHEVRWPNGVVLRQERWTQWIIERPFHDMPSLVSWVKDEIERTNAEVYDRAYAEEFHAKLERWRDYSAQGDPTGRDDPTLYVPPSGVGLTKMYWIPGMEMFAYLKKDEPELLDAWFEARIQAEIRRVAAIANPKLIPVVLTYDDIAYRTNLLFAPDWLRQHFIPRLRRLLTAWHDRDTVCIFHSDGRLWRILDDLVSAGIDGLHPLETMAGQTIKETRERYPNLFLVGGIDASQLLVNGSPEAVRAACRKAIDDTNGTGYFLGSTTELNTAVKLENAAAMFETAWNYRANRSN